MPSATTPRARKRFGQHFLTQPSLARQIVALAELTGTETVLEIGPGSGALTRLLAPACRELVLIEIDRDLCRLLREEFADDAAVRVVEGDILDMDLHTTIGAKTPPVVVANLPYNISTPVLFQLLQTRGLFSRLVLMLQREVAARLSAKPGTKAYGALSVMVQLVAVIRTAFPVPATMFSPRPKVESAVVVIEPFRPAPLSEAQQRLVRHVVRVAFSQRRKQLGNVVASLTPEAKVILSQLEIDRRRRPETLSPTEFVRLAEAIEKQSTRSVEGAGS